MSAQSSAVIEEAVAGLKLEVVSYKSKPMAFRVSPPQVDQTQDLRWLVPRATIKFDPSHGTRTLASSLIEWNEAEAKPDVLQTGLEYPETCATCSQEAHHYEVVEVARSVGAPGAGRITFPGASADKAARMHTAMFSVRYWHAVPFCSSHGLTERSVHLPTADTIELTNREFALDLASRNSLKGKWRTRSHLLWELIGAVVATIGAGALIPSLIFLYDWLKNDNLPARGTPAGLTAETILLALVLATGFYGWFKGHRGEPLKKPDAE